MSVVNIKLYDLARNDFNLSEEPARQFVEAIDEVVRENRKNEGVNELATKSFVREEITETKAFVKDEVHRLELAMYKSVFWSGLIQFLSIVGAMIALVTFMVKK